MANHPNLCLVHDPCNLWLKRIDPGSLKPSLTVEERVSPSIRGLTEATYTLRGRGTQNAFLPPSPNRLATKTQRAHKSEFGLSGPNPFSHRGTGDTEVGGGQRAED